MINGRLITPKKAGGFSGSWVQDSLITTGLYVQSWGNFTTYFLDPYQIFFQTRSDGAAYAFYWTTTGWNDSKTYTYKRSYVKIDNGTPSAFYIGTTLYIISGGVPGTFTGFHWSGSAWVSDTAIVSGLPDVGSYSAPRVFYMDGSLHLIAGHDDGLFSGFTWSGSTWVSNASLINGLADTGTRSKPTIETINGATYLLTGRFNKYIDAYKWNGSGWSIDTAILTGLTQPVGNLYSNPIMFYMNNVLYLIISDYTGALYGFKNQ